MVQTYLGIGCHFRYNIEEYCDVTVARCLDHNRELKQRP